jgi:hypothetical protein
VKTTKDNYGCYIYYTTGLDYPKMGTLRKNKKKIANVKIIQ